MHLICYLQEHFYVASKFCYVYSDAQLCSDIQLPHSRATFSGNISCLSTTATRTTHLGVTISFLSLNSKHDFCYIYCDAYSKREPSTQTFIITLTVETHILLRHLAAIILSKINNYFLPSFLRYLQHKGTLYSGYLLENLTESSFFSPLFSKNIASN